MPTFTLLDSPSSRGGAAATTLQLLGAPTVLNAAKRRVALERKTAALLAILALEGPTPRARLLHLLWPESREETARNNLVQLLRKLHALAGTSLIEGRVCLALCADVTADVLGLDASPSGSDASLLHGDPRLLAACEFDDCPDLEEWVIFARERLFERTLLRLRDHADRFERTGQSSEALRVVQRLLYLDPLSEDAHVRLMRLHASTGNRHRAWTCFEQLRTRLRRELGVEPLGETQGLARALLGGERFTADARPAAFSLRSSA
ncbi:AfsR/SARP family transcriptional regulator [Deinococcus yavapaiensis]|uniref:DNA-binding SARP family transcriptional activator n=1 Tax=Deinococcus yavapaiensis KR-236 TaxID=694435 RepID=A0A318SKU5_9DEIO|nr:BTAD domain-containing putative transcriptional regulator [Deinococcus yavapaiensis]PYE54989.1 DNA-binding SARP family transcriptional activator [Deinococcus yavapaiensis KR-236]